VEKLKQSSGINVLQTINGLHDIHKHSSQATANRPYFHTVELTMIRQLSMSFLVCDNVNQIEFNDTEIRHLIQAKYWLKKGH
jgi:hypothetical protein